MEGGTAALWRLIKVTGEASSTHLCTAAQYAALLHATSCLIAIAPTQHGFCRGSARHGQAMPCGCYFNRSRRSPRQAPLQQQPTTGADQPDAGAPAATSIEPLTSNGALTPLTENGRVDSYVYKKLSNGTPPTGPQVTAANGSHTITATDGAKPTNSGGVYGHTLTVSEPGSSDLLTITHADPTGLLVATPDENDPNNLRVREYKGY
jgi:hypothetical protein